jgi:hypothetical protein
VNRVLVHVSSCPFFSPNALMFHLFHPSALGGFEGRIKRSVERDATRVSQLGTLHGRCKLHNVVKAMEQTSFDKINSILPLPRLGQSIVINQCKWRSDILVLPHTKLSPPSPCYSYIRRFFYDRANYSICGDRLLGARKERFDSDLISTRML